MPAPRLLEGTRILSLQAGRLRKWRRLRPATALTILVAAAAIAAFAGVLVSRGSPSGSRTPCIYSAGSIVALRSIERLVGRQFDCVMVFNDGSPDWAGWEDPWFVRPGDPTHDWSAWVRAPGAHRQLVISQNLFPSAVDGTDWLQAGAAGAYAAHDRALARNLIAAGLGNSVIRLAHEANDTGSSYSLPDTAHGLAQWRELWRKTVLAMRDVPGAHFLFDWCINAYWRPIPLSEWYPGDDVVDIIGIDAYDSGVPVRAARWKRLYDEPDGIRAVLQFAAAHGKPVSIPEWGLEPADSQNLGGGDDPGYIDRIAELVRGNPIAYQSYFFNGGSGALLLTDYRSLEAYRRHFGAGGDSVGTGTVTLGG